MLQPRLAEFVVCVFATCLGVSKAFVVGGVGGNTRAIVNDNDERAASPVYPPLLHAIGLGTGGALSRNKWGGITDPARTHVPQVSSAVDLGHASTRTRKSLSRLYDVFEEGEVGF